MKIPNVLWLSEEEVKSLGLSMKEAIYAIDKGFKMRAEGDIELPAKIGVHPRTNCFIDAMPCWVAGDIDCVGMKWNAAYPLNREKGLPYINGLFCINDSGTGLPEAVMDANWITAWRTGAATGLCASYMADPDSKVVSIIGLGVQGTTNIIGIKEVLPKIKKVKIYDLSIEQIRKYQEVLSAQFPGVTCVPCNDVESTVKDADIIITCTPILENPNRFVHSSWLKNDVLAIAIDYDSAFDADIMTGGVFICDDKNQYLRAQKKSNYFHGGYPVETEIYADMGEIAIGKKESVTKGLRGAVLMGLASHDLMIGRLIYRKALEKGVGTWVKK
jgi:alanine dehydrogenase